MAQSSSLFDEHFTADRARAWAGGLVLRHPALRDVAAESFSRAPFASPLAQVGTARSNLPPRAAGALLEVVREAAASSDPAISLEAIRRLPGDPDVAVLIRTRVSDPSWPPGYRADALRHLEGVSAPWVRAVVSAALGDEHAALREASRDVARRIGPASFEDRLREVLASRRFPDDALHLAKWMTGTVDGALVGSLLASPHPSERAAGVRLSRGPERAAAVREKLQDPDYAVRAEAIVALADGEDPVRAFQEALAVGRRVVAAHTVSVVNVELSVVNGTLFRLAGRIRPQSHDRPRTEDLDVWEAWLESALASPPERR